MKVIFNTTRHEIALAFDNYSYYGAEWAVVYESNDFVEAPDYSDPPEYHELFIETVIWGILHAIQRYGFVKNIKGIFARLKEYCGVELVEDTLHDFPAFNLFN
jgi:hypothetical protein